MNVKINFHQEIENMNIDKFPVGWSFFTKNKVGFVCYKHDNQASIEIYDESGLRLSFRNYLTDESRNRFGGENFSTINCYKKGIQWFVDGLKFFYK